MTRKSGSSSGLHPKKEETKHNEIIFTILQKNTRSMRSSERFEELLREVQGAKWDVILVSETWRPSEEVWESHQGHIVMESGKFVNKHGVAIIVNSTWRNKINWVECVSERVIAASISVNRHPITLISACMPHSGYPDHQVEKTYDAIRRVIGTDRNMKIIGGDFNAEQGPCTGVEQTSVGHYTLNKANCRGEWMAQWLLEKKPVAPYTEHKRTLKKQVAYRTPRGAEKQLDYILTDKKHYCWSRDAEANDMIHMGSDRGCGMAICDPSKNKKKDPTQRSDSRKNR